MVKYKKPFKTPPAASKTLLQEKKVNHKWLAVICALIAFALYANTLNHSYTIDDNQVIKENKYTKAGIKSLPVIFKTAYRAGYFDKFEGVYRPLSVATFAIEWQIAPEQPLLGHLVNVLLYALTAFLLYNLLRKLFQKHHPLIPFLITLLYIVLPVHTEVVASIKSRDEILCFLFAVISFQQLLNWLHSKKIISLLFALFTYFLSLLSKESAITLVAVFPLITYFFANARRKELLMVTFAFLGVGIVFLGIRYAVLGTMTGKTVIPLLNNSLVATDDRFIQFSTAIHILGKYLWLLIFPVTLVYDYSFNTIPLVSLASPKSFVPFLIYGALVIYAIRNFKKKNKVSFGILFFIITISIVSNVLLIIESTMAERFLYMPSLGYCIAMVMLLSTFIKTKNTDGVFRQILKSPVLLLFFTVIIIYSGRTVARNMEWKDNLTIFTADLKSSPNSARVLHAYGSTILFEKAMKERDKNKKNEHLLEVIKTLEKAGSVLPEDAGQLYHLGIAYKELGDTKNAIAVFRKSVLYAEPDVAEKYLAAGFADGMEKKYDDAISNLKKGVQIDSSSVDVWNYLGSICSEAGRMEESKQAFKKMIALEPDFAMSYYNMGNTYAKAKDYTTAIENYQHALQLDPVYTDAISNIGNCYIMLQMRDSARFYYERAVATGPNDINALRNMGVFLRQSGDNANAELWFNKARALGANL